MDDELEYEVDDFILHEYVVYNGIKIYTGNTMRSRNKSLENIRYYEDNTYPEIEFTSIVPSTASICGKFNYHNINDIRVNNNEETKITQENFMFRNIKSLENYRNIKSIKCNYCEDIENEFYCYPPSKNNLTRKSNRGRKKKVKKTKRKNRGEKHFRSQITFVICNTGSDEYKSDNKEERKNGRLSEYPIKLFGNGSFSSSGIKDINLGDFIEPIKTLGRYLTFHFGEYLGDREISIKFIRSVTRNYKWKLADKNLRIDMKKLENVIRKIKDGGDGNREKIKAIIDRLSDRYEYLNTIKEFFLYSSDIMEISDIEYNPEKNSGVVIKFDRPNYKRLDKKLSVKILPSGKFNIGGSNSYTESLEIYYWLRHLFNRDDINDFIVDPSNQIYNDDSSSSVSASSIYDEDLEHK
jgi:hypothetical protein